MRCGLGELGDGIAVTADAKENAALGDLMESVFAEEIQNCLAMMRMVGVLPEGMGDLRDLSAIRPAE